MVFCFPGALLIFFNLKLFDFWTQFFFISSDLTYVSVSLHIFLIPQGFLLIIFFIKPTNLKKNFSLLHFLIWFWRHFSYKMNWNKLNFFFCIFSFSNDCHLWMQFLHFFISGATIWLESLFELFTIKLAVWDENSWNKCKYLFKLLTTCYSSRWFWRHLYFKRLLLIYCGENSPSFFILNNSFHRLKKENKKLFFEFIGINRVQIEGIMILWFTTMICNFLILQ